MAHGHTVTAVAALHPVFSSPDTAAHVSEPEQWPETAEVGGAAAASSPYSILSGAPCGQIAPGLSVSCVRKDLRSVAQCGTSGGGPRCVSRGCEAAEGCTSEVTSQPRAQEGRRSQELAEARASTETQ